MNGDGDGEVAFVLVALSRRIEDAERPTEGEHWREGHFGGLLVSCQLPLAVRFTAGSGTDADVPVQTLVTPRWFQTTSFFSAWQVHACGENWCYLVWEGKLQNEVMNRRKLWADRRWQMCIFLGWVFQFSKPLDPKISVELWNISLLLDDALLLHSTIHPGTLIFPFIVHKWWRMEKWTMLNWADPTLTPPAAQPVQCKVSTNPHRRHPAAARRWRGCKFQSSLRRWCRSNPRWGCWCRCWPSCHWQHTCHGSPGRSQGNGYLSQHRSAATMQARSHCTRELHSIWSPPCRHSGYTLKMCRGCWSTEGSSDNFRCLGWSVSSRQQEASQLHSLRRSPVKKQPCCSSERSPCFDSGKLQTQLFLSVLKHISMDFCQKRNMLDPKC